jgi:hypothetical protein
MSGDGVMRRGAFGDADKNPGTIFESDERTRKPKSKTLKRMHVF